MSIGKKIKKLNLRKRGVVYIEDIKIPVRTLSIAEESSVKLNVPFNIPSQIKSLTESEQQTIKESDPNYNPKTYIATKIYDKTSLQWKEYELKKDKYEPLLDSLKYIDFQADFDEVIDNETITQPYYKYLGLSSPDNWLEICEYFEEAGFSQNHAEKILIEVKKLQGDGIFERLHKIQKITNMDYVTLLSALEEVMDSRNPDAQLGINADLLNKITEIGKLYSDKEPSLETFHSKKEEDLEAANEVKSADL